MNYDTRRLAGTSRGVASHILEDGEELRWAQLDLNIFKGSKGTSARKSRCWEVPTGSNRRLSPWKQGWAHTHTLALTPVAACANKIQRVKRNSSYPPHKNTHGQRARNTNDLPNIHTTRTARTHTMRTNHGLKHLVYCRTCQLRTLPLVAALCVAALLEPWHGVVTVCISVFWTSATGAEIVLLRSFFPYASARAAHCGRHSCCRAGLGSFLVPNLLGNAVIPMVDQ